MVQKLAPFSIDTYNELKNDSKAPKYSYFVSDPRQAPIPNSNVYDLSALNQGGQVTTNVRFNAPKIILPKADSVEVLQYSLVLFINISIFCNIK